MDLTHAFCGCLLFLILNVEALQYSSQGYLRDPWIQPLTMTVTSDPDMCNLTVTFKAVGPVDVRWTTNGGFSPTDLTDLVVISLESNEKKMKAKISIPFQLPMSMLTLHIISAEHSFETHLEFDIQHGTSNSVTDINPFILFVPANTDIGISSRGQTQFHSFTNTTETPFSFGMLQAEVTSISKEKGGMVDYDVAYSFLPDYKHGKIRLLRRIESGNEYHTDIALNSPELYQNGGIISVTSACSSLNTMLRRLDMKQHLHLKPRPGSLPVANNTVGFIPIASQKHYFEAVEFDNALIRCKALGNPAPKIHLLRKSGQTYKPFLVPNYSLSHKYETLTVFQLINVTREITGTYVCRATAGEAYMDKEYEFNVITDTAVQV